MEKEVVAVEWSRQTEQFDYENYSRNHTWSFRGGNTVCASASKEYNGDELCVNPEQGFVASLSSCHMLTFLALCAKRKIVVDSYVDNAWGELGRNEKHRIALTRIELNPVVTFHKDSTVTEELFHSLLDRAHDNCFIANSIAQCVTVVVNPRMEHSA